MHYSRAEGANHRADRIKCPQRPNPPGSVLSKNLHMKAVKNSIDKDNADNGAADDKGKRQKPIDCHCNSSASRAVLTPFSASKREDGRSWLRAKRNQHWTGSPRRNGGLRPF